ncbi:IS3 family transposase [Exiguobacterium sp. SH1S21]|uniref:IS3 family transposase n=1 Tax=Exiguobacterium sp. SH1S21 TaxID=2510953 RepID=UPI00103A9A4F|nr:IS3 family transposase [Exiguobacterium sp. SH1S21]TCI50110.1 IS3 family transposase [Exiguobacterium sp. SH1S21]
MSKKLFTSKEINELSTNKYVKSVSPKGITYTDEFKELFMAQTLDGRFPVEIFRDCGFDIEAVGASRINSCKKRWLASYKRDGVMGLRDTRAGNSGRSKDKELSTEERYAKLEAENKLLKAEVELLKEIRLAEGKRKAGLSASQKYELIQSVIIKHGMKGMVSHLCHVVGVSRQGYHAYFSERRIQIRQEREAKDIVLRDLVLKAFHFKKRKKGARQIKMVLSGHFGVSMNLKCIRRIMHKYNIVCPIRKADPYKRLIKATAEHRVVPNHLKREFKQGTPYKVLLTDITYIFYGKGKRAYLSTIVDGSTNEVLAHHLSENINLDIVLDTLKHLRKNRRVRLAKDAFIHSDQGGHYTSPTYQKQVKRMRLVQSMSRRGNCWDNAVQESFFGHFKDILELEECTTFDSLRNEVRRTISYYNHHRYQWNMKKMTPVQYRNHLLQVA